jgi:D-proline reductase (dithiol) PrdB
VASLDELPGTWRLALKAYPWRRLDPVPWSPLGKPLTEARIGVVTSAGLYRPEIDEPFGRIPGGDCSFRLIPRDVNFSSLVLGQTSRSFDRAAVERDMATVMPLPHLSRLAARGVIAGVAERHASINGSITAPGRLRKKTAPTIAAMFVEQQTDAVLLVPV